MPIPTAAPPHQPAPAQARHRLRFHPQSVPNFTVDVVKGMKLRAPRIETDSEWCFIGLGNPVQESIKNGYEDMFDFLTDRGFSREDAYVVMSALAHSELGGPTGSDDPDPLHPFTAIGAVTVHRLPKSVLS